jgi:hypothetical protein
MKPLRVSFVLDPRDLPADDADEDEGGEQVRDEDS